MSWWQRLKEGLKKTSDRLETAFRFTKLDAAALEEIEDALIMSDMGVSTAQVLIRELAAAKPQSPEEAKAFLKERLTALLQPAEGVLDVRSAQPFVILMVGVNGAGKTTTIAKMAQKMKAQGLQVGFGAVDTFRMAAIEQLKVWADRTGAHSYAKEMGADPAGSAYDAYQAAIKNKDDVLFLDTAGRLQNKAQLMQEVQKIIRVIRKINPAAPHAVLLTLDATVGQNALSQVAAFKEMADVTGLLITKLDGTAKGGILAALTQTYHLPVYYIGVGETAEDLQPFDAAAFADGLLGGSHGTDSSNA